MWLDSLAEWSELSDDRDPGATPARVQAERLGENDDCLVSSGADRVATFRRPSSSGRPYAKIQRLRLGRSMDKSRSQPTDAHFVLESASHSFILEVLPLEASKSRHALADFMRHVEACPLSPPVIDAVLVRCLATLDRRVGGSLPTLVERYLAQDSAFDCRLRFAGCVEQFLSYRGIGDPLIARVVEHIESRFTSADALEALPGTPDVSARALADRFRRATGQSPVEFMRGVRLSHAARLLTETSQRIKDIWVAVGYNNDSNFNHDFKERFGVAPREYRTRGGPNARKLPEHAETTMLPSRPGAQTSQPATQEGAASPADIRTAIRDLSHPAVTRRRAANSYASWLHGVAGS